MSVDSSSLCAICCVCKHGSSVQLICSAGVLPGLVECCEFLALYKLYVCLSIHIKLVWPQDY